MTGLADYLGISLSYLSDMLNERSPLSDAKLKKIANHLKANIRDLRTPMGRFVLRKADDDLITWAHNPEVTESKELLGYLDVGERLGYVDLTPEQIEEIEFRAYDHWKKETIIPFRTEACIEFWEFDGDEIIIRGPARCGKSTLILEWLISTMFKHRGMQALITRAFGVDLDAVRQNITDVVKYQFADPLSSISVIGGSKFHTVQVNGGEIHLQGIDRPGGIQGAGYDVVVHSQAEQMQRDKVDQINSRVTPARNAWIENDVSRSLIIYDVNPARIDNYLENAITNGVKKIDFDFTDHPAYFDEDGNETELYQRVYSRLDRLEGVWRQRLLEGKAANPEGTIFELKPCHLLNELPPNFDKSYMIYRGFDFGMKDPSVCLWVGQHRVSGDVIVFREWRRVGVDTIDMGEEVKGYSKEHVLGTIIDNDENLQSILKKNCGIVAELAQKGPNSIASGITLIQHRLRKAEEGEDGGLYFYNDPVVRDPKLARDNLPLTIIDESELYAWSDSHDKPLDAHNHGWDALRYVLDHLESRQPSVGFGGGVARRQKRQ